MRPMTEGDGSVELERDVKRTPLDVVAYEVDMLRYCFDRLFPFQPSDRHEKNLLLEGYLLHYRALLEFFAHPKPRATDLSIRRPQDWASRTLSASEIKAITDLAEPVHDKWFDMIGKQLAHCTQPRYVDKQTWPITEMNHALENVIKAFVQLDRVATYR